MSAETVMGRRLIGIARWAARILAAALVLFWGAFFVAHLAWFANPQQLPPPWVFLVVGLHFLMLVGLLVGWKWEFASRPPPRWPVRRRSSPSRPGGTSRGSPW